MELSEQDFCKSELHGCSCGFHTHPTKECRCTPGQIQKYMSRISGPLLDRIDIHMEVPAIEYKDMTSDVSGEASSVIRKRVIAARHVQAERFQHVKSLSVNADMGTREVRKYCQIDKEGQALLKSAMDQMGLSARAYDRIIKVSRTIADLEESLNIKPEHLAEAIQYRNLDRELWL